MNSSACINYSKEKWPETIPSTRSCMDSLRKEAIQLAEVLNIKEIKRGFILHVIGYEWISSEEMCNYQGLKRTLLLIRDEAVPPCSTRAYLSLKEWQKGREREREREMLGSSMVTSGSLLSYRWCRDTKIKIKSLSTKAFSIVIHNEKAKIKKREKIGDRLSVKS